MNKNLFSLKEKIPNLDMNLNSQNIKTVFVFLVVDLDSKNSAKKAPEETLYFCKHTTNKLK